jgi:F0F1-type ATP synthase assembly protein I
LPDQSFYSRMARLSGIMMILPSSMGAGWLVGWGIDALFGSFPAAAIVMTLVGAGAGFYQIFRILSQDQQNPDGRPPVEP